MASVALGVFVAMNGIDLSCVLKSVKPSAAADLKDSTALCATSARTYQKGLIERGVSGEGFFKASAVTAEDADGLFKAALENTSGDYLLLLGRDGSALGALAEMMNLQAAKYDVDTAVGELIMAVFEAKATKTNSAEIYQIGVFLFNQTVTESTNGAAYDSTSGGTGYLIQIHVLDGDDNATITIQHSTNGTVWVDLVEAEAYSPNTAAQRSNTATVVNRYVRAAVAPNSGTVTVAVGVKVGYSG